MCPAIMLAVKRSLKVRGWIILLILSIKTKKKLRNIGLLLGVMFKIKLNLALFNSHIKIISQNEIAMGKLSLIWAVLQNVQGNNPIKLKQRIRINKKKNLNKILQDNWSLKKKFL